MKKFYSVVVILSYLSQSTFTFASEYGAGENTISDESQEVIQNTALIEIDKMITEVSAESVKSEARARKKIFDRFSRDFEKLTKRVKKTIENQSEDELRVILEASAATSDGHFKESIQLALQDPQFSLKTSMLNLISTERRADLENELNAEIEKAGSAVAYLKNARASFKSANRCMWKKVGLIALVIPVSGALFLSSVGLALVLALGGYVVAFGGYVGTIAVMAAAFYVGGAGVYQSGEYIKKHSCKLLIVR